MADWNDPRTTRQGFGPGVGASPGQTGDLAGRTTFDAGLRKHMLSIYNYMASGVLLTGVVAMLTAQSGLAYQFAQGPLMWLVALSPLAIVFAMSFGQNRFSTGTLQALFWGFAFLMGLSLSTIFLVYTGASIAATFFATAGAFAGLSLFGYTTQKDLSGWGSFLIMGVIGLIIASLINLFLQSEALSWAVSFIGVLIFAGLTAYDTQRLKAEYLQIQRMKVTNPNAVAAYPMGKMVVMGALSLYLDFINMFLFLLRFMGSSRE
jgi:FtsH-binding integral membrane protein